MKDIRPSLKVLIDEDKIHEKINELAHQISIDYKNKSVTLVSVLKGSIFFTVDLAKKLDLVFNMEFVEISSYGNELESSGNITVTKDLTSSVNDKHIIILEDIIDTGRSLKFLTEHLKKYNPLSISTCVLLDKIDRRTENIDTNYTGFVIPDKFIIGYGMDYCDYFRNVNYIGYLEK